jgi:protoporphyrinogen oxidase
MVITRRDILGSGAAASLLPFAGSLAGTGNADLDVAIVGGGVAGAYMAWRLRNDAPHLRVRLFEMSDRIGGRLRSVAFPQAPHLVAEVGGMRFQDAHRHVAPLVAHLNLPKRGYPLLGPNNRLDLRGRSLTYEQARASKSPPFTYNVPPEEMRPNSPVYLDRISRIIPDVKTMTAEKWRRQRANYRYKGRALKDWTGWMLLSDVFSREEMAFGDDSGGYDQDESINGLNAMDFNFMGPDFSKPFYTLIGGYQRLPLALAQEARKLGADIAMHARLRSVIAPSHPGQPFQLAFEGANGARANVTAKRVVLALPRRSIELIDEFPLRRDPAFAISSPRSFRSQPARHCCSIQDRGGTTKESPAAGR